MMRKMVLLQSILGVGQISAAHFMAEDEDISRFATYQKLIAYTGAVPSLYQSGESHSSGQITKRGNRSLRRYVCIMARRAMMYSYFSRTYYGKRRNV